MSQLPFVVAVSPDGPIQHVRAKQVPRLIAEGYVESGKMGVYACYVLTRKVEKMQGARSGAVRFARADARCTVYAAGQRMGNVYEFARAAG